MKFPQLSIIGAFVMTAVVLNCRSQPDSVAGVDNLGLRFDKPTCPSDHPSCGDGDTTTSERTVDISGGLMTLATQQVPVGTNNKRLFQIGGGGNGGFEVAFDLTNTYAAYTTDPSDPPEICVTSGGGQDGQLSFDALAALMIDPNQDRGFTMRFFRREQDQQLSQVDINWSDPNDGQGSFDLWVGDAPGRDKLTPEPDVVVSESDPDADGCVDYTFSSGAAQIAQSHGTGRSHPSVVCPLGDEVTLKVCPT